MLEYRIKNVAVAWSFVKPVEKVLRSLKGLNNEICLLTTQCVCGAFCFREVSVSATGCRLVGHNDICDICCIEMYVLQRILASISFYGPAIVIRPSATRH